MTGNVPEAAERGAPPNDESVAADGIEAANDSPQRLQVQVVTGDRTVYDGVADRLIATAIEGQISILVHHAPMLAVLEPGELVVRSGDLDQTFAVGGGFVEVRDDQVIVLADSAERAEEIDVERAIAARERARALMASYQGRPEAAAAWQALRRSRVRLRVAQRRRS